MEYIKKYKLKKNENIHKKIKIGIKPEQKQAGICVYLRVKYIHNILSTNNINVKELLDRKIKYTKDEKGIKSEKIYNWSDLKNMIHNMGILN